MCSYLERLLSRGTAGANQGIDGVVGSLRACYQNAGEETRNNTQKLMGFFQERNQGVDRMAYDGKKLKSNNLILIKTSYLSSPLSQSQQVLAPWSAMLRARIVYISKKTPKNAANCTVDSPVWITLSSDTRYIDNSNRVR